MVSGGIPGKSLGSPDTETIKNRIGTPIATARQRNAASAKQTPATRLPQDMSMDEHVAAATEARHMFSMPVRLETDTEFAVEACARLGPQAMTWRYEVFKSLRRMATAMRPLDVWALNHRPTRHCAGWAPVLTSGFIHLLRWEDRTLPWCLVEGFQVVGKIPPCGIHRTIDSTADAKWPWHEEEEWTDEKLRSELLVTNAIEFINELEKTGKWTSTRKKS